MLADVLEWTTSLDNHERLSVLTSAFLAHRTAATEVERRLRGTLHGDGTSNAALDPLVERLTAVKADEMAREHAAKQARLRADHEVELMRLRAEHAKEKQRLCGELFSTCEKHAVETQRLRGENDDMRTRLSAVPDARSVADVVSDVLQQNTHAFMSTLSTLHLNEVVKGKDAEIARLRNTSVARGRAGEGFVENVVAARYPSFDVRRCGHEARSMDIHVHAGGVDDPMASRFFAIETKVKARCTRGDITKFERDFDALHDAHGDAFAGAIFVSVASPNIPHKGSLALEVRSAKPLIYVGFHDADHELPAVLPLVVEVLLRLADRLREAAADPVDGAIVALQAAVRTFRGFATVQSAVVQELVATVKKLLHRLEDLRAHTQETNDAIAAIVHTCLPGA
jgi:hypothetical protein